MDSNLDWPMDWLKDSNLVTLKLNHSNFQKTMENYSDLQMDFLMDLLMDFLKY